MNAVSVSEGPAQVRLAGVPGVLEKYRGRERALYGKLAQKYGVNNGPETWRADALSTLRVGLEFCAAALEQLHLLGKKLVVLSTHLRVEREKRAYVTARGSTPVEE